MTEIIGRYSQVQGLSDVISARSLPGAGGLRVSSVRFTTWRNLPVKSKCFGSSGLQPTSPAVLLGRREDFFRNI